MIEDLESLVKGRVDEYLILVSDSRELMVKLANGEVSTTQSWRDYEVSIYLAKSGKIAAASYTTHDPKEAIKKTMYMIDSLEESPLYAALPEPSGKEKSRVDPRLKDTALQGDASWVLDELELEEHSTAAGMVSIAYTTRRLVGSNGADLKQESTSFNGYIRIFKGGTSGQWAWTSTVYDRVKAARAIGQAASLAEECSKLPHERVEPGTHRVLLGPMIAANLLQLAASAANAGSIILGFSFLQNRGLGSRVGSDAVTILEKPLDDSMPLFTGFDDEGVATRDKVIFEKGVFKTVLHNTKTAKIMGDVTTGNAGWVLPRTFNLEVAPGSLSEDEMLEALGDGIYATNNWYTRFQNYLEGTFSTVTRDALFIVRRGKPVACSSRARLASSMPDLLNSIEDLSRNRYDIQWWEVEEPIRTPYVLVSSMKVSRGASLGAR